MKLIESHNQIRIMNDKGTKLLVATQVGIEAYKVDYITKGVHKILALCATKEVINHYAVELLSK